MFLNRLAPLVATFILTSTPLFAADEAPVDGKVQAQITEPKIERNWTTNVPLRPDIVGKKIFIEFMDSPKGSKLLQSKLAGMGYDVVPTKAEADVRFEAKAFFNIAGAGKEKLEGKIADLFEATLDTSAVDSPDYRHQNISLTQIAATSAYLGGISISQVGIWISQQLGIAGRFNKMITGDPRGWCYGEICDKRSTVVIFAIRGAEDQGRWWGHVKATDTRMLLDFVAAEAIQEGLKPFADLKAASLASPTNVSSATTGAAGGNK